MLAIFKVLDYAWPGFFVFLIYLAWAHMWMGAWLSVLAFIINDWLL